MNLPTTASTAPHRVCLITLLMVSAFVAWGVNAEPTDGEALHLIISHAEVPLYKPSGQPWDPASGLPDVVLKVRYPQRAPLGATSDVPLVSSQFVRTQPIKNSARPQWMVGLTRVELRQVERGGLEVTLVDKDPLGEQLIDRFFLRAPAQEHIGRLLMSRGAQGARLYFEWRPLERYREPLDVTPSVEPTQPLSLTSSSSSSSSSSHQTTQEPPSQAPSPFDAAHLREAQRLYRAYLSAYLNEDLLTAHERLLTLATRYAHTRYGLKAQRLLRNPQR